MRSLNAIKNIITSLILQIIIIICGFILPKIIINTYGSNVNGLIVSITQFLSYIALLEAGVGPVIKASLYKPLANKDYSTIIKIIKSSEKYFKKISLIFIFYLIALLFIYPNIVSKDFQIVYTISLILILSVSTFAEYFFGMTYSLFLKSAQKTYIISIIQIVTYILNIIVVIVLSKMNVEIHFLKLFSGIIFTLRPIILSIYVKKKYKFNFKYYSGDYKIKNKWDGMVQHIAAVVHDGTDVAVLTLMSSLKEVSVYSIYSIVIKGINRIIQSFYSGIDASFGDMIAKNETKNLNKNFNIYEIIFFTITTIIYTCTIILITPFVSAYTREMSDANYIRPFFGYLIVIGELIWTLGIPYCSIILAAGHFKETKKGTLVEAIINIVLSLLLVRKYGITGVAIGTLIAMLARTIVFIYYGNKNILKRSSLITLYKMLLIIIEILIVVFLVKYIPIIEFNSYTNWIKYAIKVFAISFIIVFGINSIVYKKQFKDIFIIVLRNIKKTKLNN